MAIKKTYSLVQCCKLPTTWPSEAREVAKGTTKRVVGTLVGEAERGCLRSPRDPFGEELQVSDSLRAYTGSRLGRCRTTAFTLPTALQYLLRKIRATHRLGCSHHIFHLSFTSVCLVPEVWFLDHNYHEAMFAMFKKASEPAP